MKTFFPRLPAAITALLLGMGILLNTVQAQEADPDQRHADMAQRRAEFLANNPDAAARMAERQREREEFLAANPQAGEHFGNRRHQEGFGRRGEHAGEGEGRPQRRREFGGRESDGRHQGPPPGRGPGFRSGQRQGDGASD